MFDSKYYYFELKYQTSKSRVKGVFGNDIVLKNQAAEDLIRFDYLKDILRLYEIAQTHLEDFGGGYAIILSNNKLMYDAPSVFKETSDYRFRIHDRRGIEMDKMDKYPIPGMVLWNKNTTGNNHWTKTNERNFCFMLPEINTKWEQYLKIIDLDKEEQDFRYLINEVQLQSSSIARRIKMIDY